MGIGKIGPVLYDALRRSGRQQKEVAAKLGMKPQALNKILRGRVQNPGFETIQRLAIELGVDLSTLVGREREAMLDTVPVGSVEEYTPTPTTGDRGFQVIDFHEGLVEVPVSAEVACGEPMDYSVHGETALVPLAYAPDDSKNEYLVRARGDSMVEFGILDGWYVVVERRVGGVAASGELILAWYEPSDRAVPGGITLKRWFRRGGRKILQGSTPESTFELKDGDVFELQGIVRLAYPPPVFFPKISG